jgi:hypothetical protein
MASRGPVMAETLIRPANSPKLGVQYDPLMDLHFPQRINPRALQ